jgi:hypothetical protein
MKSFFEYIAENTSFVDAASRMHLGTVLELHVGEGFTTKTRYVAKGSDGWYLIDRFGAHQSRITGLLTKDRFDLDVSITGAAQVSAGIQKGGVILNVIQMQCLPNGAVVQTKIGPDTITYTKKGDRWFKHDDPKGYDAILFVDALESSRHTWLH